MRRIIKLYEKGSVQLCGLRGTGKDMLTANVILRRNKPYVSNIDYGGQFLPLDLSKLDCHNDYTNFISGKYVKYVYPYPDKADIYVSEQGLLFPSQYQGILCRDYPTMPYTQALIRHFGDCNWHGNSQFILRAWDKIREQGEIYLKCNWCIPFAKPLHKLNKLIKKKFPNFAVLDFLLKFRIFNLVIQKVTHYERIESCAASVPPFCLRRPLLNPDRRQQWEIQFNNYRIAHGEVKPMILIYFNRSNYNTRFFKELLENGTDKPKEKK